MRHQIAAGYRLGPIMRCAGADVPWQEASEVGLPTALGERRPSWSSFCLEAVAEAVGGPSPQPQSPSRRTLIQQDLDTYQGAYVGRMPDERSPSGTQELRILARARLPHIGTAHWNERGSEQQQRYGGVGAESDPAEIDP
jgi:hypothetical protein